MRIAVIGSGIVRPGTPPGGCTGARRHGVRSRHATSAGTPTPSTSSWQGRHYAIDTGFIVFNDWTYPRFIALLNELGVAYQHSNMSFSLRCERTGLEYNGTSLNSLFAQRLQPAAPVVPAHDRRHPALQPRSPRAARRQRRRADARRIPRRSTLFARLSSSTTSCRWACRSGRRPKRAMLSFPARFFVDFFEQPRLPERRQPPAVAGREGRLARIRAQAHRAVDAHRIRLRHAGRRRAARREPASWCARAAATSSASTTCSSPATATRR